MSKIIEMNNDKLILKEMIEKSINNYLEYLSNNNESDNKLTNKEINTIINNTLLELQNKKYLREEND